MPIIQINLLEGRTVEQKRAMVAAVTDAIVSSLAAPRESVRIIINELGCENFAVAGTTAGQLPLSARNGGANAKSDHAIS